MTPQEKIAEKIPKLREMGYSVSDTISTRPATGENVLYVNGQDLGEQFVDQLLGGADFQEVVARQNRWLNNF